MRAGESQLAAGTAHVPEVDQEEAEMEADGLACGNRRTKGPRCENARAGRSLS